MASFHLNLCSILARPVSVYFWSVYATPKLPLFNLKLKNPATRGSNFLFCLNNVTFLFLNIYFEFIFIGNLLATIFSMQFSSRTCILELNILFTGQLSRQRLSLGHCVKYTIYRKVISFIL